MTHAEEGYGSCLESLVVSGDEAIIAARLTELLEAGLDELLLMTVQVDAPSGEQARLAQLIGQLSHG